MHLSVVVPVFNNHETLNELAGRFSVQFGKCCIASHELIFVDDGSVDDSWEIIQGLSKQFDFVRGLKLSRNFGQHSAISAGFDHATGKIVLLMDADLEDKPEDLHLFVDAVNQGADLALGVDSAGPKRRTSAAFRWISSRVAPGNAQPGAVVTYRAATRRFMDELGTYEETDIIFGSLMSTLGFEQRLVPIVRDRSRGAVSSYSFRKRLDLAARALVAHSEKVPSMLLGMALVTGLVAAAFAAIVAVQAIVFGPQLPAGTSLLVFLVLVGLATQLGCFSFLGYILVSVLKEVKRRPRYHVADRTV